MEVDSADAIPVASKPRRPRQQDAPRKRLLTIPQTETNNPGLKDKLRDYVKQADADNPDYAWFKPCIVRIARSVFIDEIRFNEALHERTALPPAPPRNPEGRTRVTPKRKRRPAAEA